MSSSYPPVHVCAVKDATLSQLTKPKRRQQRALLLFGLCGMLIVATLLACAFSPFDQHSRRMMHPLSSLERAESLDGSSIRYLIFGSASALGEGLEDISQAYPYQLSASIHNAASRVGGVSLSAICTQSIVGDKMYDVIIVEFEDKDVESVTQLAKRIRQRFPKATLVFFRLWSPATHIIYNGEISVLDWWRKQQEPNTGDNADAALLHSYVFQSAVLDTDANLWSFIDNSANASFVDSTILNVQGHIYNLPYPQFESAFSVLTSPGYMELFQGGNPILLSESGHHLVAQGIRNLLKDEDFLGKVDRNVVGTWGTGDSCSMWYASGDYSALRSRRRASLVDFSKQDDIHRHALEISRRGGSVDVTNPFEEPRMLYLTYMTAAISTKNRNSREYPRTKISLGGKPSVLIDPVHDVDGSDDHVTRTTAVGMVPPGKTNLQLKSLDANSKSRFRLVGLHFLDSGKMPIPFEYALEPEPAQR